MDLTERTGAIALSAHLQDSSVLLAPELLSMLQEHHSHQTERRGCGYTQASRWLAVTINRARSPLDLLQFGDSSRTEWIAALRSFVPRTQGQTLLCALFTQVLLPQAQSGTALKPIAAEKLKIGTCPLAEQFFLEIACDRIRRGGSVNLIVDAQGQPILLEKRGLGDEHSSISLAPCVINEVCLPAGTLIGLDYDDVILANSASCRNQRGKIIDIARITQFRYLRLTTLAVDPKDRALTFSTHFAQQVKGALFLPDSARIEQLQAFAERQL
jgi:hypothetical protein